MGVAEYEGDRTGPTAAGEALGERAQIGDIIASLFHSADRQRERIPLGAALDLDQVLDRRSVQGPSGLPIDRFGWKGDQFARADQGAGVGDVGLIGRLDGHLGSIDEKVKCIPSAPPAKRLVLELTKKDRLRGGMRP